MATLSWRGDSPEASNTVYKVIMDENCRSRMVIAKRIDSNTKYVSGKVFVCIGRGINTKSLIFTSCAWIGTLLYSIHDVWQIISYLLLQLEVEE